MPCFFLYQHPDTQGSGQTLIGPQLLSGALGTVKFFLLGMKSQQPGQTVGKYWEKESARCQEGGSLVGGWCLFIKGDASSGGGARERELHKPVRKS